MKNLSSTVLADHNARIIKGFARRLNQMLDVLEYPRQYMGRYTRLADRYGVSVQTSRKWCKGLSIPSPAVLLAMAHDFSTSVDALLNDHGLAQTETIPPLFSIALYENSFGTGSSLAKEVTKTKTVVMSHLPFVAQEQQDRMALVVNWVDLQTPDVRPGDVLVVGLDCQAIAEGGTYVVRTPSTTALRIGSVSLSNTVRFTKVDRAGNLENTDVPVERLSFNTAADFMMPAVEHGGVLIVGRVLGYYRQSMTPQAQFLRANGAPAAILQAAP